MKPPINCRSARAVAFSALLLAGSGAMKAAAAEMLASPPLPQQQCAVDQARRVHIRGANGEEFGDIVGVGFVADTILAVGDRLANQVKFFSTSGRSLGAHGREGSGPGEVRHILKISTFADTVVITDPRLRRASYVTLGSGYVRSEPYSLGSSAGPLNGGHRLAVDASGGRFGNEGPESWAGKVRVRIIAPDGTRRDIAELEDATQLADLRDAFNLVSAPYLPGPLIAGRDDQVVFAERNGRIRRFNIDGSELPRLRSPFPPAALSRKDMDSWIQNELDRRTRPEAVQTALTRLFSIAPQPEYAPALAAMALDPAGRIWVQEYRAPFDDRPARTAAISRDGVVLTAQMLPGSMKLTAVSSSAVVFVARDEFDVETIVVYPLRCG